MFGFGSREAGIAGAAAASANGFSAGHYNPAGLAFGEGKRVDFGFLAAASNLEANGERHELSDSIGVVFGATTPAPLGGVLKDRLHVGVGLYLLPTTVARVIAHTPDEPFFPYYDNRTQRLVVLPTVAARLTDRLAVGFSLNLLAGLSGQVIAAEGPTRAIEARVDEEIFTTARVNLGARFRATPELDVALVYRQAFSVPFSTVTDNEVAGEPIDLDIRAEGLYTPHQVVLGGAYRVAAVELTLDATYARWSDYPGPFVHVESELPLVGPLAGELPAVPYDDTIGVRAGLEWRGTQLVLRGGYGFETSPIPAEQPGVTNLLDGPKHTFAAGVGWAFCLGGKRMRLDAHLQAQVVGGRTLHKEVAEDPAPFDALRDEVVDDPSEPSTQGVQISNPGYPSIESGGQVFSSGLTLEVLL